MSKPHPTPGPWEAVKGSEPADDMRCAVVAKRGKLAYLVATIENGAPGDFCDTEYANALLMAAAPELLKACSDWIDWLKSESPWREDAADYEAKLLDAMRHAIASARGETA